ncbi:MAG: effector-associated domain EAD1-containing protein [Xenococcaceae cyanobacterium]
MRESNLAGKQRKQLREALISAFPGKGELEIMLSEELDIDLDEIAKGDNYQQVVFNLIKYIEAQGEIQELLRAAKAANSNNPKLKQFEAELDNIVQANGIQDEPILIQQDELILILKKIDFDRIKYIYRKTLPKQAIIDNLELGNPDSREDIVQILLKDYPDTRNKIPSIIEFALRLAKFLENDSLKFLLQEWVESTAQNNQINLPDKLQFNDGQDVSSHELQSFLLITVEPLLKGNNKKFRLKAELIPDYQENNRFERYPIELNQEDDNSGCPFDKIPEKINQIICKGLKEYLYGKTYELTVELFLTRHYLGEEIDLEQIPDDFDKPRAIGKLYRLVLRSYERIYKPNLQSLLRQRWNKFMQIINRDCAQEKLPEQFEHINCLESCNWDELAMNLEYEEKLGVKISCALPKSEGEREKLFIAILAGGVPLALWTRCSQLPNFNLADELDKLLTWECLNNLSQLYTSVWKLRRQAHIKGEEAKNYPGYHLGLLCDNPHRIPFHRIQKNARLTRIGT